MITKREYNKALKIIKQYQEQEANRKPRRSSIWLFIWFDEDRNQYNKFVRASKLDTACRKFLREKPKAMVSVDEEVENKGKYYDISDREDFKEYI